MTQPIRLIVNADDYGYFPCVSRGILQAARSNSLTAAGIIANSPDLKAQMQGLENNLQLDFGVHLNLTHGKPLTQALKLYTFPSAYQLSLMILTGKIKIEAIRSEWSAQIDACRSQKLYFLNSHEHIHMLPVLFNLTLELSEIYRIPFVRLTRAEWIKPLDRSGFIRNAIMQSLHILNKSRIKTTEPLFIGLNKSGKIDVPYLARLFSRLERGKLYELMCHPGHFDPDEILDDRLKNYHDWQGELDTLQSLELKALYEKHDIRLSYYHDLTP